MRRPDDIEADEAAGGQRLGVDEVGVAIRVSVGPGHFPGPTAGRAFVGGFVFLPGPSQGVNVGGEIVGVGASHHGQLQRGLVHNGVLRNGGEIEADQGLMDVAAAHPHHRLGAETVIGIPLVDVRVCLRTQCNFLDGVRRGRGRGGEGGCGRGRCGGAGPRGEGGRGRPCGDRRGRGRGGPAVRQIGDHQPRAQVRISSLPAGEVVLHLPPAFSMQDEPIVGDAVFDPCLHQFGDVQRQGGGVFVDGEAGVGLAFAVFGDGGRAAAFPGDVFTGVVPGEARFGPRPIGPLHLDGERVAVGGGNEVQFQPRLSDPRTDGDVGEVETQEGVGDVGGAHADDLFSAEIVVGMPLAEVGISHGATGDGDRIGSGRWGWRMRRRSRGGGRGCGRRAFVRKLQIGEFLRPAVGVVARPDEMAVPLAPVIIIVQADIVAHDRAGREGRPAQLGPRDGDLDIESIVAFFDRRRDLVGIGASILYEAVAANRVLMVALAGAEGVVVMLAIQREFDAVIFPDVGAIHKAYVIPHASGKIEVILIPTRPYGDAGVAAARGRHKAAQGGGVVLVHVDAVGQGPVAQVAIDGGAESIGGEVACAGRRRGGRRLGRGGAIGRGRGRGRRIVGIVIRQHQPGAIAGIAVVRRSEVDGDVCGAVDVDEQAVIGAGIFQPVTDRFGDIQANPVANALIFEGEVGVRGDVIVVRGQARVHPIRGTGSLAPGRRVGVPAGLHLERAYVEIGVIAAVEAVNVKIGPVEGDVCGQADAFELDHGPLRLG